LLHERRALLALARLRVVRPIRHVGRMPATQAWDERRDERPRAGGLSTRRWRLKTATRSSGAGSCAPRLGAADVDVSHVDATSRHARDDLWLAGHEVLTIFVSASGSSMAEIASTAGCSRRPRCRSPPPPASEQPRPERAARRPAGGAAGGMRRKARAARASLAGVRGVVVGRSRAQAGRWKNKARLV